MMSPELTSYVDFKKRRLISIFLPALGNWTAHPQLQVPGSSSCVPAEISNSLFKARAWLMPWRQFHDSWHCRAEAGYKHSPYRMWPPQLTLWLPKILQVLTAPHYHDTVQWLQTRLSSDIPMWFRLKPTQAVQFQTWQQMLLSPNPVLKGTSEDNC